MDPYAKTAFKQNCYPFYDRRRNRGKTISEIKSSLKCQTYQGVTLKNSQGSERRGQGSKLLYFRNDNHPSEYRVFPKKTLQENTCISNYNQYIDPHKGIPGHNELTMEDLFATCSTNDINQINPDRAPLLDYISQISQDLKVKKNITLFIFNLVMYTNITRDVLEELFKGGFVIVRDGGFLYKKNQCDGRDCDTRSIIPESSHESMGGKQYRLGDGVLYHCDKGGVCDKNEKNEVFDLLIGRSILPDFYGDTWFQFEYANLLTFYNKFPLHGYSFAVHKAYGGMNIGPLGNSGYSEYLNILFLDVCTSSGSLPVPCVTPPTDIFADSAQLLVDMEIDLSKYKMIKDFVKGTFSKRGTFTIESIIETLDGYHDRAVKDQQATFSVSKALGLTSMALADLLLQISTRLTLVLEHGPVRESDFEQIIEILFLSYNYALHSRSNEEFVALLNKRYRLCIPIRRQSTRGLVRSQKSANSGGRRRTVKR
jgi:hypothetical protein